MSKSAESNLIKSVFLIDKNSIQLNRDMDCENSRTDKHERVQRLNSIFPLLWSGGVLIQTKHPGYCHYIKILFYLQYQTSARFKNSHGFLLLFFSTGS